MAQNSENYLGNPLLKNTNVKISYTKEQIAEYIKCEKDPIYFIEKYIKVVNLDSGLVPLKLYDFQKKIIRTAHKNRFTICKIPRQSGKCLCINTMVTVRNKRTGAVENLTIGELYAKIKNEEGKAVS